MESVILPPGKKVSFNGKEYQVKPLPIRKYKVLLEKVAEIVDLSDLKALMGEESANSGVALRKFADAPDKLAEICELATGITKDEVLDGDIEQVIGLLIATIQVNNIIKVFTDAIKKIKGSAGEEAQKTA